MKISKDSSSKYDQDNKERLQNKLVKDIKVFLKKKKKKVIIRERYKNLSKNEKRKLVEYKKKQYRMRRNTLL